MSKKCKDKFKIGSNKNGKKNHLKRAQELIRYISQSELGDRSELGDGVN
jgi:hypothetical protein